MWLRAFSIANCKTPVSAGMSSGSVSSMSAGTVKKSSPMLRMISLRRGDVEASIIWVDILLEL